jgi:hypothetical protein
MCERRTEARRRTLLSGRLSAAPSDAPAGTLDCVVLDLSEHGARLLCRSAGLDGDVVLQLKASRSFKRRARIAWRRVEDCGVEFIGAEQEASAEARLLAGRVPPLDPSGLPQPSATPLEARF